MDGADIESAGYLVLMLVRLEDIWPDAIYRITSLIPDIRPPISGPSLIKSLIFEDDLSAQIGCGLDGLQWPAVRTLIKNVLQDRIHTLKNRNIGKGLATKKN